MENNTYLWLFLIIIGVPFFLLTSVDSYDQIEFVEDFSKQDKDALKIYSIRVEEYEGRKEQLNGIFKNNLLQTSYYKGDTVDIKFNTGSSIGFNFLIHMVGDQFRYNIIPKGSCMPSACDKLIVSKQELKLKKFSLSENSKIEGTIYCEAHFKRNAVQKDTYYFIVKGDFETTLLEANR